MEIILLFIHLYLLQNLNDFILWFCGTQSRMLKNTCFYLLNGDVRYSVIVELEKPVPYLL